MGKGLVMDRQVELSLMSYYDEDERKFTLVTNKIVISHEPQQAS